MKRAPKGYRIKKRNHGYGVYRGKRNIYKAASRTDALAVAMNDAAQQMRAADGLEFEDLGDGEPSCVVYGVQDSSPSSARR